MLPKAPQLKPQDVLVLLKLAVRNDSVWSYPQIAAALGMSASEVHAAIQRAVLARLAVIHQPRVIGVQPQNLLEFLRNEVVFVGGAVVDLFITDPAAPRPRFTEDIDVVVEVVTHAAWARVSERLRALGFREDQREGAPLCRWLVEDLVIDVMPALERVLGFSNRWYRIARKESEERELPGGVRIRAVSAPLFLATKTEAFRSRGRGDFVASHDPEDIIAVVDGRPTLADEVKLAPARCAGSWPPGEAATGAPCHQGAGNPAGARSRRS